MLVVDNRFVSGLAVSTGGLVLDVAISLITWITYSIINNKNTLF